MKRLLLAGAVIAAIYVGFGSPTALLREITGIVTAEARLPGQGGTIESGFSNQASGTQVSGTGTVSKMLADDNDGSRHQRFILTLASGQTLLVAHNIDLAPRLDSLERGDRVEFHGVYEWNAKGGVIHWTHRDPRGRHEAGWLKHAGRTYQ